MSNNFCIVCLNTALNLKSINESDSNEVKIIIKLQKCVPEVDWKSDSLICFSCLEQLEIACTFHNLCIQSYLSLQNFSKDNFEIKIEENSDFPKYETAKQEFICFHCQENFPTKDLLENHINAHNKKVIHCDSCGKKLSSENSFKRHRSSCVKKEKEKVPNSNICPTCGTSFATKYLLKRHLKNVHATEKKFVCDLCDRKFTSLVYLNAHKKYHSGDRKHICSFCGKGYKTASDLYHHEKIHATKRQYQCPSCPKAFKTSSDLHKHKICVHSDHSEWKYECNFCQKKFPLKTNLDTHIKTHTGEKNFLCHLCDKKCINRSVLNRHIESHSLAKKYKCGLCLQSYKYDKSLSLHMVKIHGIGNAKIPERVKKFFCNICPKSYFANNKLQKHIRSHTGERPFRCPACDKCFVDSSYIKQHLKIAHNLY